MMSIILRRSSSSSVAPKRALAALTSIETLLHHHSSPASSTADLAVSRNSASSGEIRSFSGFSALEGHPLGIKARDFHVKSGSLDFRASLVSQAEFAVDDYSYDEEKGLKGNSSSSDDGLEISKLGIAPEIVSALARKGITKLFPIQKAVLEPAMQGRDMIGRARTGTGKTLAFGIPILDKIIQFNAKHGRGRNPLCLVMAPTRELAKQVEKEFCEGAPSLDTICVYGGTPISGQMRQLDYGVDVVVGTPGRIIDLLKRGALNLSEVQFVVLDEADQMLSVGFEEDVEIILEKLPKSRQSMMFSATMPSWIKKLVHKYLKDPLTVDLVGDSDQKLADGISIYSIASNVYGKASIIGPLITEHAKGGKCIVFTQTKRDADRLAYAMARNFKCEALHGDISQSQRERTLLGFREGRFNVLVATDVASRGLDVPNVDLVIHYELPNSSEIFVHRTGRTGRAGKKGSAILIYTQEQARAVKLIEREIGSRFTELPTIAVEGGSGDMFGDMGSGGRLGSYGGMRDRRYGGQSDSGFGRSGGYRSPSFGRSGQAGEYGGPSSGRFGSNSNRSGNFSGLGHSRSSGSGSFGDFGSGRFSGFDDNNSRKTSGGFGNNTRTSLFGGFGDKKTNDGQNSGIGSFGRPDRSSTFGDFGSGRSSGFGDNNSSQTSGGLGNSRRSLFDGFGDK